MDPTHFTRSNGTRDKVFHRAIEPNNPRSALQLRYISLNNSFCNWLDIRPDSVAMANQGE
jgi:hypothetical protein